MALSDPQIERYSRQILLPEVGGRGQERLLAARVAVLGTGPAAGTAATLLGRAGVGSLQVAPSLALQELSPDCSVTRGARADAVTPDLVVDLRDDNDGDTLPSRHPLVLGTLAGTHADLLTLAGRPCVRCLSSADRPRPRALAAGPLRAIAARSLGALAATEALRVLLLSPMGGRRTTIDADSGAVHTHELAPVAGCPACGGEA
jgi:adenylyltransferase/sulfurtransferase